MARKNSSQTGNAELLRQFVATFGTWDEMIARHQDVPPELRAGSAYLERYDQWQPIPFRTAPSAAQELEGVLPGPLPALYREFVLSYRYLEVDLGRYRLLANPPSEGLNGLYQAMFCDSHLYPTLRRHGYIQFGM